MVMSLGVSGRPEVLWITVGTVSLAVPGWSMRMDGVRLAVVIVMFSGFQFLRKREDDNQTE